MTTLATRAREIADLEGFDVQFVDHEGTPIDVKQNGFGKYNFDRKLKGTATVAAWKAKRFDETYPGKECRVLYGDGNEANGNATLATVRASYEASDD